MSTEAVPVLPEGGSVYLDKQRSNGPLWWVLGIVSAVLIVVGVGFYLDRGDFASQRDFDQGRELTEAQQSCRSLIAARYDAVSYRLTRLNTLRSVAYDTAVGDLAGIGLREDFDRDLAAYLTAAKAVEVFDPVAQAIEDKTRDVVAVEGWTVPPEIVMAAGGLLPDRFEPCPTKAS